MNFGVLLRQHREKHQWTQPEAAAKIAIEQSYLSKLETGKSYPSEEIFDKLVEVYKLDINELCRNVSSDELDKLKDIKKVRDVILKENRSKVTTTRSWLVAGLIMLALGAASLGAAMIMDRHQAQYTYRSEGLLKLDEELNAYDLIEQKIDPSDLLKLELRQQLLVRVDQQDQITTQYRGEGFVENLENGRRFFTLIHTGEVARDYLNRWFIVPAFTFLTCGFACFFISRRWR